MGSSRTICVVARLALVLLSAGAPLRAQTVPPSPEDVLGYSLGKRFTDYAGVRAYSLALADASPLATFRPYGVTPEHRELFQVVLATPEHRGRLDAILAANAELTRPETSASRAAEIARDNPAVVYFSYGVHGNESSSSEAALWTMWDLARGAPSVAGVLDSLIVVVDPVTNPDGRDRYVQWFRTAVGTEPDPDPQAREHHEPWPGGRFNHYLFDLNRDWSWMTQPETRARLATWDVWNPVVHVDFHEMGYNSGYFFFPAADPINPIYPDYVLEWGARFGQANAAAFDAEGWEYFTGDNYDLFYPGYGDSWPSLVGAIGMTYEQGGGGAAGLAIRTSAGDTLTLRDRALHHWTTGAATLRTTAAGKSRLILDYAAAQRATGAGEPDVLLVPGPDTTRLASLVQHLLKQGIEVERANRPFRTGAQPYPGMSGRRDFPEGTYRVRARQPRGRLATTLLQPRTTLTAEFSYDISAWSLPYAYGVEAHATQSSPSAEWSRARPTAVDEREVASTRPAPAPGYGYLVPPGAVNAARVAAYLREGGRARVLSRPATFGGREWPAGTWFLPAGRDGGVRDRATAAGLGTVAVPVPSGLAQSGPDLGSRQVHGIDLPRLAVLTGEGVSPTSYGAHWYFLEQIAGLGFTALPAPDVGGADLSRYDVLVIPGASGRALDDGARERLQNWVRGGGRLVAMAGGAELAAEIFEVGLRDAEAADTTFLLGRRERETLEWEEEVPGAILPVRIDPAHPLVWGAATAPDGERMFVLHQGDLAFEPAEGIETVAYFPDDLTATSGVISAANLDSLERSAWLVTRRFGSGSVVLFADDPLFRLFWKTGHDLYMNALLLGGI
jgi:hypothetical protein